MRRRLDSVKKKQSTMRTRLDSVKKKQSTMRTRWDSVKKKQSSHTYLKTLDSTIKQLEVNLVVGVKSRPKEGVACIP